jgi:hypothetical protein
VEPAEAQETAVVLVLVLVQFQAQPQMFFLLWLPSLWQPIPLPFEHHWLLQ